MHQANENWLRLAGKDLQVFGKPGYPSLFYSRFRFSDRPMLTGSDRGDYRLSILRSEVKPIRQLSAWLYSPNQGKQKFSANFDTQKCKVCQFWGIWKEVRVPSWNVAASHTEASVLRRSSGSHLPIRQHGMFRWSQPYPWDRTLPRTRPLKL